MINRDLLNLLGDVGTTTRDDLAGLHLSRTAWSIYPIEATRQAFLSEDGGGRTILSVAQHATDCPECGKRIEPGSALFAICAFGSLRAGCTKAATSICA